MPAPRPNLPKIIAQFAAHYGKPEPPITTDPFELILLENVAYLVSDDRRERAFKTLRQHAGTKPHEILAASHEDILRATKLGGMHPEQRVSRLKEIALIAMNEFGGDLSQVLKLPLPKAKQALRRFSSIGEPSAEKILLFTRAYPVLGLDSNGLRVLVRLGFGEEKKNYTATYRAVQEAIRDQLKQNYDWLISAHILLRQHGKELCKTNAPLCEKCPVKKRCAYFRSQVSKTSR
jgi:endonuclease III related protein